MKIDMSSDKRPEMREETVPSELGPKQQLAPRWDRNATPEAAPLSDAEEAEEVETPAPAPALAKPAAKKTEPAVPPGVLRWTGSSVHGHTASRIQQCLIYQVAVAKNPYWTGIVATRGRRYLSQDDVMDRLVADTPDDYVYEEDGVIGWKRQHVDGEERPVVSRYVRRKPKTEQERARVREAFGVTPHTRKLLAKDGCPRCRGTGSYKDHPYPDNENLTANVECQCSWE